MQGDDELRDLYREVLIDYYKSASHKGRLDPADLRSEGKNPLCGDEIALTFKLDGETIRALRYEGHGCVISQASTAMLASSLEGQTLAKAGELASRFKDMMLGRASFEDCPEEIDETKSLEGVAKFPVRIKCAILAWNTLLEGLKARSGGQAKAQVVETEGPDGTAEERWHQGTKK